MKLKKVLDTLRDHLEADRRKQVKEYASLKKILKQLKKKRDSLHKELKSADSHHRERIKQKLEIVRAQRQKGIDLLKTIKAARKKGS